MTTLASGVAFELPPNWKPLIRPKHVDSHVTPSG